MRRGRQNPTFRAAVRIYTVCVPRMRQVWQSRIRLEALVHPVTEAPLALPSPNDLVYVPLRSSARSVYPKMRKGKVIFL